MFYELMMRKKEQIMYATIKGSLTENDGVFSGFSSSNYLQLQNDIDYTKNYEIVIKFKTTSSVYHSVILSSNSTANSIKIETTYGTRFRIFLSSNGTSWNIANGVYGETNAMSLNNDYYLKFVYSAVNGYAIYLSSDKVNWSLQWQTSSTSALNMSGYKLLLGLSLFDNNYLTGNINLPNSYIKLGATKYNLQAVVGYTIVGSPTITDGVVSGFSSSDYLETNQNFPNDLAYDDCEYQVKFTLPNSISEEQQIICVYFRGLNDGIRVTTGGRLRCFFGGSSNILQSASSYLIFGNTYIVRLVNKNNKLSLYCGIDENNLQLVISQDKVSFEISSSSPENIGVSRKIDSVFSGSIDMNSTYTKVRDKLWFNGQQA